MERRVRGAWRCALLLGATASIAVTLLAAPSDDTKRSEHTSALVPPPTMPTGPANGAGDEYPGMTVEELAKLEQVQAIGSVVTPSEKKIDVPGVVEVVERPAGREGLTAHELRKLEHRPPDPTSH